MVAVQLKSATRAASVGTASMGKFDKRAKGEDPVSNHLGIKRRKFEPVVGNTGKETEKVCLNGYITTILECFTSYMRLIY